MRLLYCMWLLAMPCLLLSQSQDGTLNLSLLIKTNQGTPMQNAPVEFFNMRTGDRISAVSDSEGRVEATITGGRFWQINVDEIRDYFYWQFEVPPSHNLNMKRTITYDKARYLRESRPPVDRSQLNLKTKSLQTRGELPTEVDHGIIHLRLHRPNRAPLSNYPVSLTCYNLLTTFQGRTNANGEAWFRVPRGQEYEVDIDGIESFAYVDLPDVPRFRASKRLTYEPTLVQETTSGDTTVQQLPPTQKKGTSARVLVNVSMRGGPDGPWRNEPVYLEVLGEKRWYKANTDSRGEARFLIPKGRQYMIHGRFEPDLDVFDLRRNRGIGHLTKSVLYRPREKYQFPDQYIPHPEDLLVRGFADFLENAYPGPAAGNAARLLGEFTGVLQPNSKEAVLRLALTTRAVPDIQLAPPLNLALVIDKSGSMAGHDRIEALRRSLVDFLKVLRPTDRVALVTFSDFAELKYPSSTLDLMRLGTIIENVEANGGTNIYKGLMMGYEQVAAHYKANAINRVVLLSDGYGETPPLEIVTAQKPFTNRGIQCTTVGVGQDYNVSLLKLLAKEGHGSMRHLEEATDIEEDFATDMIRSLFPVARHVEVELFYPEGLQFQQIYGPKIKSEKGRRLFITLDELTADAQQLAFLSFSVANARVDICQQPVRVTLRYRDLASNQLVTQEMEIPLNWDGTPGQALQIENQSERKMYAIAVMNQSLKVMADAFHQKDLAGARRSIDEALVQLRTLYPQVADADLNALKLQLEDYLDVLVQQERG